LMSPAAAIFAKSFCWNVTVSRKFSSTMRHDWPVLLLHTASCLQLP
jgi:hypothetical protein